VDKATLITNVRNYVRDKAELNALLPQTQESSDADISLSIDMAVSTFNTITPITGFYDVDTIPFAILMYGTIIELLTSAGILQSRNELNYSDGGISVATSNKTGHYQSWIGSFVQKYMNMVQNYKRALNAEQAYGGVSSMYSYVNTVEPLFGSDTTDVYYELRFGYQFGV
jgi:hypothetical protein